MRCEEAAADAFVFVEAKAMPAPASAVGGLGPAVALLPSVGAGEAGPFEEEETGRTLPRRLASEHAADAFEVNTRRIKTV